jgi:hypothetical protein
MLGCNTPGHDRWRKYRKGPHEKRQKGIIYYITEQGKATKQELWIKYKSKTKGAHVCEAQPSHKGWGIHGAEQHMRWRDLVRQQWEGISSMRGMSNDKTKGRGISLVQGSQEVCDPAGNEAQAQGCRY